MLLSLRIRATSLSAQLHSLRLLLQRLLLPLLQLHRPNRLHLRSSKVVFRISRGLRNYSRPFGVWSAVELGEQQGCCISKLFSNTWEIFVGS